MKDINVLIKRTKSKPKIPWEYSEAASALLYRYRKDYIDGSMESWEHFCKILRIEKPVKR